MGKGAEAWAWVFACYGALWMLVIWWMTQARNDDEEGGG